jgi:hypothetical protein
LGAPARACPVDADLYCKNCSREDFVQPTLQYLNCRRGSSPPTTLRNHSPFRTRFPRPLAKKVNCSQPVSHCGQWRFQLCLNAPDGALPRGEPDGEEPDGEAARMDANFAWARFPSAAQNAARCAHSAVASHSNGSDTTGSGRFAPDDSGSDGIHSRAPCCGSTLHSSTVA